MENNQKIVIKPRTHSGEQDIPPPPQAEAHALEEKKKPLLRIKSKSPDSGYHKLLDQLTEEQRKNLRLKRFLIAGSLAILALSTSAVLLMRSVMQGNHQAVIAELANQVDAEGKTPILQFLTNYTIVKEDVISMDQSVTSFLGPYMLPEEKVREIENLAKKEGILQLKAGKDYFLLRNTQNTRGIEFLIYEMDDYRYGVFQLFPEAAFQVISKEIETRTQQVSGVIKTNLFDAIASSGINYKVMELMENALQWSIDFYHLHPGDRFKVIYEEKLADDETVEVGPLKAVYFSTNNREYFAFLFNENGAPTYFNNLGKPMKSSFLKSPLKYGRITSHFSLNRLHPVQKVNKPHWGTDFAAEEGTEIYAVGEGVIEAASFTSGNGNYVKIRHERNYTTTYLHMQKFAPGIQGGKRVRQGEVIGYVGQTGLATGPHVCFRFTKNGAPADYLEEDDIQTGSRLTPDQLKNFVTHRDSLMQQINTITFH